MKVCDEGRSGQQGELTTTEVEMPTWLLILIVVLLFLAVFGGYGYWAR